MYFFIVKIKLVCLQASSLNPIDTWMTEGYGNEILSHWRNFELNQWNLINSCNSFKYNRLPLITGRDCSGEIVEVGLGASGFSVGDEVKQVL